MLRTKNLKKVFSKNQKISFSDIDLKEKKLLFIKGPSGSGKTTFMKILGKLDKNYNGDYKSNFLENEIGYFFHDYRLISNLSIMENIFLGNIYKDIGKIELEKQVEKLAKKLGIFEKLKTPVKKLSSGEYQRICLIRTFVGTKKLFLLDEPTSHLDKESSLKVSELILKYYKKGAIFVISSHDDFLFSFLKEKIDKKDILNYEF